MTTQRNFAKLTGYSLLLMTVIAGFCFGYVFPQVYGALQAGEVQQLLAAHMPLYKNGLAGVLVILLLDVLVAWTIYRFFINDNKSLAFTSFVLRVVYVVFFGIGGVYLVKNLTQTGLTGAAIIDNYNTFTTLWYAGLIVFGFHLLAVGVLMKQHRRVPAALWWLTIIAGASYVLVHTLKVATPQLSAVADMLSNILGLPMALGEILLAVWLLIKGGKPASPPTV